MKEVTKGKVPLSKGQGQIEAKLDEPGWLVLNINAHDLPIDESEQFYKDQAARADRLLGRGANGIVSTL